MVDVHMNISLTKRKTTQRHKNCPTLFLPRTTQHSIKRHKMIAYTLEYQTQANIGVSTQNKKKKRMVVHDDITGRRRR